MKEALQSIRRYLEQVHRRGVRRSSWTQSATTITRIIPHGSAGQPLPTATWTPVERDVAFERRLLGIVAARMELPAVDRPIPADSQHVHFGRGQTETAIELPPGTHELQLMLGDRLHIPHDPPVVSERITITVVDGPH